MESLTPQKYAEMLGLKSGMDVVASPIPDDERMTRINALVGPPLPGEVVGWTSS